MIFKLPSIIFKIYLVSFIIWVFQTTIIPQTLTKYTNLEIKQQVFHGPIYPYTSLTIPKKFPIVNSTITLVIAHPDDEVMFFSPSLIELNKEKYNNEVNLICFSNGNFIESMGLIRRRELMNSARILGVDNVKILDYKDGMNETWKVDDIVKSLEDNVIKHEDKQSVLITFDDQGVSNHPNHISLYHGTKEYVSKLRKANDTNTKLYVLKSLNFVEKYSFTILSNIELFIDYLTLAIKNYMNININVSFFGNKILSKGSNDIKFYSDLNMLSISYGAMAYGHFSQMVWFRYGWLFLSRYLTYNHLIEQ